MLLGACKCRYRQSERYGAHGKANAQVGHIQNDRSSRLEKAQLSEELPRCPRGGGSMALQRRSSYARATPLGRRSGAAREPLGSPPLGRHSEPADSGADVGRRSRAQLRCGSRAANAQIWRRSGVARRARPAQGRVATRPVLERRGRVGSHAKPIDAPPPKKEPRCHAVCRCAARPQECGGAVPDTFPGRGRATHPQRCWEGTAYIL